MYVTVAQPCKAFTMSKLTNSMQTLHLYLDHDAVLPVFIMDARNMAAFPDQSFDLVIDKGEVILLTVAAKPQPAPGLVSGRSCSAKCVAISDCTSMPVCEIPHLSLSSSE